MALVWLFVIALFMSQEIFVSSHRDCSNIGNILNCDECIRCGGHWCNDPNENIRCTSERYDNWCPGSQEQLKIHQPVTEVGRHFNPKYTARTIPSGMDERITIAYKASSDNPKVDIVFNSTQNNFYLEKATTCEKGVCQTSIDVVPETDFCTENGGVSEYFNIRVSVENITEEAVMKFHVPCACGCSEKVELQSPRCNGRGSYSCGICTCDKDWSGASCETPICNKKKRGDVPCTDSTRSDVECSGNGVCSPCDECVCFTDRIGSQYYDKDNFCADICMITNDCDDCFKNPIPGRCDLCHFNLIRRNFNETLLKQKDEMNRNVWITCNDTIEGCYFEYVAMKDASGDTYYMVTKSCDPVEEKQVVGGVNVTVPIVLGALAVAAAVLATAGYLMWRARPPALPLADPLYTNIGAEDCTGENPLYKPPTSSFKNPTYGKW